MLALTLAMITFFSLLAGCNAKNDDKNIGTADSVALENATYGVMMGSTSENYVTNTYPDATISTYPTSADAFTALAAHKVDYVVAAQVLSQNAVNTNPDLAIFKADLRKQEVAMAVDKSNTALLEKLNAEIDKLRESGKLAEITDRWMNAKGNYNPVELPVAEGKNGTLRVAASGDQEPLGFVLDGTLQGLDIELIAHIAYELDMKVEYQLSQFAGLIASLSAGKADLICSAMAVTEERKQSVNFTVPYLDNPLTAVCRATDLPQAIAQDDTQEVSQAVAQDATQDVTQTAAETSSTAGEPNDSTNKIYPATARYGITSIVAQDYLIPKYPNATVFMFPSAADAMLALQRGKLDFVMTSQTTAGYMIRKDDELHISSSNVIDEACNIAVSKQKPELREKIDAVLSRFKADGTLNELNGRWALDGPDYYHTKQIEPALGLGGKLTVAISPDAPPICFMQDNKPAGIDIELMELIAKELDMTLEFVTMDFDALLPAIQSGKVDVAISDINATDERKKLVDFTQSYFDNPQVLVTSGETIVDTSTPQYATLDELSGKNLSCITGSIFDQLVLTAIPDAQFSYYNTTSDELAALRGGKVEGVPVNDPVAKLLLAQNDDIACIPESVSKDSYGMVLTKGNPMTAEINREVAKLREDGVLDEIFDKWMYADENTKLPDADYPAPNGTLRAVCATSLEPMCYADANGVPCGYEVEVIMHVGQALGKKVELILVDFGGLIPMVQSGKADVGMGCMTISDSRKQTVDMTDSHRDGGVVVIVRKAVPAAPTGESFWDGLKASFTRTFITENRWKLVLDGLKVTALISICSGVLGTLLGFGICMLRRSKSRLISVPAAMFIRLIQGTPIVVMLMILYYIVFGQVDISAILVSILGFSVNLGVYVSEMMRTGIDAVDSGQIEAAHALGFTKIRTFWKITFPQAARHFLPVFKGEFISMVKMTSVVGYIAIQDLTKVSDIIRSRTLEAFFPLIATAIIYFIVANILTMLLSHVEIKLDPKRRKRTIKGVVMQ